MKKLLIIPVLLLLINSNAQSFIEAYEATRSREPFTNLNGTYSYDSYLGNPNEWSKIMGVLYQFDDIRFGKMGFDGSVYLFDEWENKGIIVVGNKRYVISNINFHISQDAIMSKIEEDSTFVFNFQGIDKILINNRVFKSFYNSSKVKNKVYEVIYENQEIALLKGYTVSLIEASPNPMVNRYINKIKRTSNYYIYKNGAIQSFKLKKSNIQNLVSKEKTQKLEQYVKDNNLSYKKENNVIKMLNYISKL